MLVDAAAAPTRARPLWRSRSLRALVSFSCVAALALSSRRAAADIFAFKDAEGTLHLSNKPRGDRRYRLFVRSTAPARRPGASQAAPADASPDRLTRYAAWIGQAAALYRIPEELIRAIIACESDFDPRAISKAGAVGLMQLMPATAARMQVRDAFDPRDAIFGGARYLRFLADRFEGDVERVVAAYNAGEDAVERYAGIPPYEETRGYVARVLERYRRYRTASGAGALPPI